MDRCLQPACVQTTEWSVTKEDASRQRPAAGGRRPAAGVVTDSGWGLLWQIQHGDQRPSP